MPHLLNKTKAYLCGHMQYGEGRQWRDDFSKGLEEIGVKVFDPYKNSFLDKIDENDQIHTLLKEKMEGGEFDWVANHMKKIRRRDLAMVDKSDFLVFYFDPSIPTVGTIEELSVASRAKKPIFVAVEGGKRNTPFWIMGMLPHHYIYDSLEEIAQDLQSLNEENLDRERWRLLLPEYR